jgi:hypothetical protein
MNPLVRIRQIMLDAGAPEAVSTCLRGKPVLAFSPVLFAEMVEWCATHPEQAKTMARKIENEAK